MHKCNKTGNKGCKPVRSAPCVHTNTDCVFNSEDLEYLEMPKGNMLTKVLEAVDDKLKSLKQDIDGKLDYLFSNTGTGAKVLKEGIFGIFKYRTILSADDTITVTEEEDEIKIKSNYDTVEIKTVEGILGGGELGSGLELKIDPTYQNFEEYYTKNEIDSDVIGDGKVTIKSGNDDIGSFNLNDETNTGIDILPAIQDEIGEATITFRREGQDVDSFNANEVNDKVIDLGDLRGYPGADLEARYSKNTSFSSPPSLNSTSRNPAGWSKTVPTTVVGEYVWFTTATIDHEDNLEGVWTTPIRFTGDPGKDGTDGSDGQDGQDGDDGVTGYNSITLSLYRRQASAPSSPASGLTYTFSTKTAASIPTGWTDEIPTDNGQPCWISITTIVTRDDVETVNTSDWTVPVKYVESGKDGNDGSDGVDGSDGQNGTSSAVVFLYTTTDEDTTPTQPSSLNYDFSTGNLTGSKGVWTETVPISSDPIIWFTVGNAVSSSNTVDITNWSSPAILSKPGTPGKRGPSVVFRGTWNNKATYHGSEDRVDFVIMPETTNGYITTIDAGNISGDANKPTTATAKWNGPIANSDAIFTDFLIAYSAHIDDLTVGVIQTGPTPIPTDEVPGGANTDFERTTIGYNPPAKVGTLDYEDPTSGWSRHGIRQYWPNGRIMSYQGYVESFIHNDLTILNEWALIVWLDDGEPSYFQSKSGDVKKYITQGTTVPSMHRFGTLRRLSTKPSTATDMELLLDINAVSGFNSSPDQTNSSILTPSDSAFYTKGFFGDGIQMFDEGTNRGVVNSYDKGDIAENQTKYQALYMIESVSGALDQSDPKTTPPLIPDGWYDRGVGGSELMAMPRQGEEDFILRLTYYKDGLPVGSPKNVVVHTRTT